MSGRWRLLQQLIVRPLVIDRMRTALTVLAIALGVAVVVAIDLAGEAAAGSFHSSLQSLTGESDYVLRANAGLDEKTLGTLAQLPYPLRFAPRIEDFAFVADAGETVTLIGLDFIGNAQAFAPKSVAKGGLEIANGVWVSRTLGRHEGEHLRLTVNDRTFDVQIAGLLPKGSDAGGNIVAADIGWVQAVTGKAGRLDSIEVRLPRDDRQNERKLIANIQAAIPAGVRIEPQGARTQENRKMLAAFRWNLHVLSYIALLVGGFLIYNAISISVVRRRVEIGILRAIGAGRGDIVTAVLAEAAFLAVCGSALGLAFGRLMAGGAVQLISTTVQSLYISSTPGSVELHWSSAISGIALGIGVSLSAAFAPAIEAGAVAPVEAMARGREQSRFASASRVTIAYGIACLSIAALLAQLPPVGGRVVFGYISVLLGIAGTVCVIPHLLLWLARAARPLAFTLLNVEGLLALQALRASLLRTSVLTAALATSVAMTASVGIMVGSFRETVSLWMESQLRADFYLRPAGSAGSDRYPTMQVILADRVSRLPEVAAVDRFRAYPITVETMPATLASAETARIPNARNLRFLPGQHREAILRQLPTGNYAIVSEPFANKHHVHAGSVLPIPFEARRVPFTVIGVYYDYSAERGYVLLDRQVLLRYSPDTAISSLAAYLKSGADTGRARREIEQVLRGHAVLVFSNRQLREGAIDVFDRTFRITYALEAVAVFVAVAGVAGSLLTTVIDRRREFALLKSLGAERWQVRRMILVEAGMLGLLALVVGLLLGSALSLILIFVINKQSFGWTIQFHWPAVALLSAMTGIYVSTVLAGLFPARTAVSLSPMEVMREG